MTREHRYAAYGLALRSNRPIPGLIEGEGCGSPLAVRFLPAGRFAATIRDCRGVVHRSNEADESGSPRLTVDALQDGRYRFRYGDGATFVIDRAGREVWAAESNDLSIEDTATYLLGSIMRYILRLRGHTSLHASASVIDGRAVAFVGRTGMGKSTTVTALAHQGFPTLADDVVALNEQQDCFLAQPGCPLIRIWPETAEALYPDPSELPRILPLHPTWDKRYVDLRSQPALFHSTPVELMDLYVLDQAPTATPQLERMVKKQAFMTLLSVVDDVHLDEEMRSLEFEALGRLVKSIRVKKAVHGPNMDSIPEFADLIVRDVRRNRS